MAPTEARSRLVHDARAAAGATCGSAGSRTGSASRSRTTTATSARRSGRTGANLPYAWRILRKGVCDGCALGVAGFHDWTISGVHLCTTRLDLLKVNTATAIDRRALADVDGAATRSTAASCASSAGSRIRWCGNRGERGFRACLVGRRARPRRRSDPRRRRPSASASTSRRAASRTRCTTRRRRRRGSSARTTSTTRRASVTRRRRRALKETIGVAATTCSYRGRHRQRPDRAVRCRRRQRAARLHEVPVPREEARREDRGRQPAARTRASSATGCRRTSRARCSARRSTDEFFSVHTGGDVAFLNGVLKELLAIGGIDRRFVTEHTIGFDALARAARGRVVRSARSALGRDPRRHGAVRADVRGRELGGARVVDGDHAARDRRRQRQSDREPRARARQRRPAGAGLMPIRGHSGVQGGAEMGCYATPFPGGVAIDGAQRGRRSRREWGFDGSGDAGARRDARWSRRARRGDLDVLWSSGGNFLDVLPAPDVTRTALARTPLRVHQDIVRHASDARRTGRDRRAVAGRDALRTGGWRHVDHDRAPRRVQSRDPGPARRRGAQPSGRSSSTSRAGCDPERADRFGCETARGDPRRDRARRARVRRASRRCARPATRSRSAARGLCEGGVFPTPDGRAHFSVVVPAGSDVPDGRFVLSTRRGKQFNSMVWKDVDPLTGAARDALLLVGVRRGALGVGRRRRGARALAARRDARPRAPRADPRRQRAGVLPGGQRAARAEPSRPDLRRSRLQRRRRGGPDPRDARRPLGAVRRHGRRGRATRSPRSTATSCATAPIAPASTRSTSSPTRPRARCSNARRCGS